MKKNRKIRILDLCC